MFTRRLPLFAALLLVLPLGGCSYVYNLLAVVADGQIVFVADPKSSPKQPCLSDIRVITATADRTLVLWNEQAEISVCLQALPLAYGAPFEGGLRDNRVEAKPLQRGVSYRVLSGSSRGGSSDDAFVINADGRVETFD